LPTGLVILVARALVELPDVQTPKSEWLAPLDRAEELAASANGWRVLHRIYLDRGATYELTGDLQRSLVDRKNAANAAERAGEIERVAFAYRVMASDHMTAALELDPERLLERDAEVFEAWMQGSHSDALEALAPLLASARQHGNVQGLTSLCGWYADFGCSLGGSRMFTP
jgi:hypothetical protein